MRARPTVLAALPGLLLAGCLETKDEAKIDAKGAGTISQVYEIDLATAAQLMEMAKMYGSGGFAPGAGGGGAPPLTEDLLPDVFSSAATQALAKGVDGFTLRLHEDVVVSGKRTVKIDADFLTLEAVAKAGRFVTAGVELAKNPEGSWTLAFDHAGMSSYADVLKGPDGKGAIPGFPEGTDLSAVTALLEPMLGSLSVKRTIAVPGTIVETNGTKSPDGASVTWKAGYADLMDKGVIQKVTFKGEGIELKPFRFKPNFNEMFRRLREAAAAKVEEPKPGEAKPGETKPGEPAPPPVTPPPTPTPAPK